MNEMLKKNTTEGETRMKKMLLIAVLAVAMIMAFGTSTAFAKYAGFSVGAAYVDWSVASSMASQNADSALETFGPHKGYATTTIKCAVCHSMHRADNKILSGGGGCAYCHTTSYYGGAAFANTISWKVTAGAGPHSSCASSYCHGGPHGVGASSYAGPATRLIVAAADTKILADTTANGYTAAQLATWDATTRVLATGGLCSRSGCHVDSAFGIVTGGTTLTVDPAVGKVGNVATGHRVIATANSDWNFGGYNPNAGSAVTLATKTGKIAWAPVSYCNSCHDLTDDNNGNENAFPHAIDDVVSASQGKAAGTRSAVWLTAGPSAGQAVTAVSSYNDYTGSATVQSAAGASILDGICLKCHRGNAGASGVGIDF